MQPEIIFLDLDGTLLNDNKKITSYTMEVLRRASDAGIWIVPCSGRKRSSIEVFFEPGILRYLIALNGAEIYDLQSDICLHRESLSRKDAQQVFLRARQIDGSCGCFQDGLLWLEQKSYERMRKNTPKESRQITMDQDCRIVPDLMRVLSSEDKQIQKITVTLPCSQIRNQEIAYYQANFPNLSATSSIPWNVEIGSRKATKANAMVWLCKELGISMDSVMACGDNLNDMEMLQTAGIAVAMRNGDPEILRNITLHSEKSNDQDGAAVEILRYTKLLDPENTP